MSRLLEISPRTAIVVFVLLEAFTIGMGMGVPFFTIPLGFPVGWFAARRLAEEPLPVAMRDCLRVAGLASLVSLAILCVIWLPWLPTTWGSDEALAKTGVPLILYAPRASFIGWLLLMVVISPALQLLAALAASYVTLMRRGPHADRLVPRT